MTVCEIIGVIIGWNAIGFIAWRIGRLVDRAYCLDKTMPPIYVLLGPVGFALVIPFAVDASYYKKTQ